MYTKPHIGIYCPGAGTGGPWRYVHSLLAGLDPTEYDATVFCDLPGEYAPRPWVRVVRLGGAEAFQGGAAARPAQQPSVASRPARLRRLPAFARVWAGFAQSSRRLARLIRRHPVDLFHTQNTGCEESPVAAKLAGVPRVLGTFHVDSTYDLHRVRSGPVHRVLEQVSNRCLDAGIAVSRETGRNWIDRTHIPARRVITVYNGIDPDRFVRQWSRADARRQLGLPEDALVVGGLGRLDEAKGFTYLIASAARLQNELPNLVVAIAGDGPLRKSLENEAARFGVAQRVRFLGFQRDVQLTLDSLDVFALPSRCEALPYAVLEAMAGELPVVGTTVGGVPEMIVPGETGLLVPPCDASALAESLRVLLRDANLRARMGVAGRERVIRHFHERDMVRRTIRIYWNMLRNQSRQNVYVACESARCSHGFHAG